MVAVTIVFMGVIMVYKPTNITGVAHPVENTDMEVSINGGYPNSWLVYFMENPNLFHG